MGFFDWRRPPDEAELDDLDYDLPEPRMRHVGSAVPLELLLARSDEAALVLRHLVADAEGFTFTVVAHVRRPPKRRRRGAHAPMLFHTFEVEGDELPPEFVRLGLEFPDGTRVTNVDESAPWPDATEPAHGLMAQSGSGGDLVMEEEFVAWPLPGPGALAVVCEWPAYGIPETRREIDAGLLRDAAARAEPIWANE